MTVFAKDLACIRRSRLLFKDLSFALAPGEALQIIGGNGVGKSSLLRIVAGLLAPQAGDVEKTGQSNIFFYLGHALGLKSGLTLKENLLYHFEAIKLESKIVFQLLDRWSLSEYVNVMVEDLSQGQKQRLALVKLMLSDTRLWILDEPFSSLDVCGIDLLSQAIKVHLKHGGSVLLASHQKICFEARTLELGKVPKVYQAMQIA